MVLDKLGDSLKNTLQKITSALFIDEKLINELIKDIQRALLQSDVNVNLVFELTKKIKERALKEDKDIPRQLSKKEYLIKIVYEELVNFLGGEGSKILINKKPFKILLVGLFGSGKCVHKDTNILINDGQTMKVEEIYDIYKHRGEFELEDGFIVPLGDDLYVPTLNIKNLKIEKKRISYLWKLKSKNLMEIKLDNGNNFSTKTTYEHPFFILKNGFVEQKRADELKSGEYIAVPAFFAAESKNWEFKKKMCRLNLNVYTNQDEIGEIKKHIRALYGSIKNAVNSLPYKRNYEKFTCDLKKGQVPISLILYEKDSLKIRAYSAQDFISFPTRITPELAEIVGYVIGDGYLSKNTVHIANEDEEIIERVKFLSQYLFSKKVSETRDKRTKKLVHLRISSLTLVELMRVLFNLPIGKKGRKIEIPKIIQESSLEVASCFVRAYFDCDAHFPFKRREIEICSQSQILLKQLQHMLLRFNIVGNQGKKNIQGREYFRMSIQARSATRFFERIGSLIKRKQNALQHYKLITIKQGDGKQDMIPVGDLLKRLRESGGYSINQIQKNVSSYGLYEKKGRISKTSLQKVITFYEKKEKGNYSKILNFIENKEISKMQESLQISQPLINALLGELKSKDMIAEVTNSPTKIVLTEKGKNQFYKLQNTTFCNIFETLKMLAYSDLCWIKVNQCTKIKNDSHFVYDLTVEDNHNFIADGIILHNTTTAGKLANFYKKRGFKVALLQTDTWRPAAYEQLKQLSEKIQVSFFGNKKEKNPVKIYKSFQKELLDYDLVIVDTAGRDALSEELIEELNDINKAVDADENLLVISADIGQAAEKQAVAFNKTCNVTGVIITKLEGTAKGGGALIACSVTKSPVKFIGLGETIDALEEFKPEGFVGRLLGMGDLEALLEKAKEAISEDEVQDLGKRFLKGEFNLLDLYEQMQAVKKMGSLSKIMELIPGFSSLQLPKEMLEVQQEKLEKWKHAMDSMTKEELEDPEIIDGARSERISKGSGVSISDIRSLVKQYRQAKKLIKTMKGGEKGMEKMMRKLQQGQMPGGVPGGVKFKYK